MLCHNQINHYYLKYQYTSLFRNQIHIYFFFCPIYYEIEGRYLLICKDLDMFVYIFSLCSDVLIGDLCTLWCYFLKIIRIAYRSSLITSPSTNPHQQLDKTKTQIGLSLHEFMWKNSRFLFFLCINDHNKLLELKRKLNSQN